MSTTAYLANVAAADPFTGTAAVSVFDAAPANLTDADAGDRIVIEHTGSLLNNVPDTLIEVVGRLRADGVTIHTVQFGAVGFDDDRRDVFFRWTLTLTAGDTCRVLCESSISGAGGQGPDFKAARSSITRDQAFALPVTFDVTVQLDENDAVNCVYTPDDSILHKVEPTLSAGAPAEAAVLSVNGLDGVVVLDAYSVDAVPQSLLGMPTAVYNTGTGKYPGRGLSIVPFPTLYVGPVEPTTANCNDPDFLAGVDYWWRTP